MCAPSGVDPPILTIHRNLFISEEKNINIIELKIRPIMK